MASILISSSASLYIANNCFAELVSSSSSNITYRILSNIVFETPSRKIVAISSIFLSDSSISVNDASRTADNNALQAVSTGYVMNLYSWSSMMSFAIITICSSSSAPNPSKQLKQSDSVIQSIL